MGLIKRENKRGEEGMCISNKICDKTVMITAAVNVGATVTATATTFTNPNCHWSNDSNVSFMQLVMY